MHLALLVIFLFAIRLDAVAYDFEGDQRLFKNAALVNLVTIEFAEQTVHFDPWPEDILAIIKSRVSDILRENEEVNEFVVSTFDINNACLSSYLFTRSKRHKRWMVF